VTDSSVRRSYDRKFKRAAALTVLLLLAAACDGGSQEARDTLHRAAERTTSVDSFHVESVITDPHGRQVGELDYVAPDRYRMKGFGEGASITIQIGRDTFASTPEDLNRFVLYENPCDFGIGGYFPALEVVGLAEHVDRVGRVYRFSVDGEGNPEGEVRIEDGYIVSLVFRYNLPMIGIVEERHSLGDFDSDIRIEPPPASQIEEESPQDDGVIIVDEGSAPDCSTSGGPPSS
jgi:hypothetical protein